MKMTNQKPVFPLTEEVMFFEGPCTYQDYAGNIADLRPGFILSDEIAHGDVFMVETPHAIYIDQL